MRRMMLILALAAIPGGCTSSNTSPGNDREAELEPRVPAAEVTRAGAAIAGVATGLLKPEIMTDADVGNIPDLGGRCTFRMTEVGFPVFVYGASEGVVKLNGKLIPLPAVGNGHYVGEGVDATIRALEEDREGGEHFAAEFVLRLPGAANELGFHGLSGC